MFSTEAPQENALVIHPLTSDYSGLRVPELRLIEAQGLTEALGLNVVAAKIENARQIRPSTYFGKGKIDEIKFLAEENEASILILDTDISPVQQRNLEKALNLKVIDRTGLILEIFSLRARTKEGKLQVELARLSYEKSRLVRTWTHLERQRGGTGKTGGPGERQIELDRRIIADKILKLKKELEEVRRTRHLQRAGRERVPYPIIALVGYTNAGKSTLFNKITHAKVLAKDMLFATLDTTSRLLKTPNGRQIILSDTVGFITDLPHELIASFRATLEEVAEADILLHVRDISSNETEAQKRDVDEILDKILEDKQMVPAIIEVWNKVDLLPSENIDAVKENADKMFKQHGIKGIISSAETGLGIDDLLLEIEKELALGSKELDIEIKPNQGNIRAYLYEKGAVKNEKLRKNGNIILTIVLNNMDYAKFINKFPEFSYL